MRWRVPTAVPAVKLLLAAVFAATAVLVGGDLVSVVVAAGAAVGLAFAGGRDLVAPVRLTADEDGVTVTGALGGVRHHRWDEIEQIRVDDRRRLLGRSVMLEIDAGDALYFLGRHDLGAAPAEVADALRSLRIGG